MAKLYYGGGNCSIEGSEIRGVQIRYKGAIEIEDKTSDSIVISHQGNGILIFPIGEGTLNELFDYSVQDCSRLRALRSGLRATDRGFSAMEM